MRELTWEDLHWEGTAAALRAEFLAGRAWFEIAEYKGRARRKDPTEPRVLPISPRLGKLLWRLCRGRLPAGLIFRTVTGKAWTRNALRLRMRRARERAQLAAPIHGERIVCYTIRHTTATDLADKGMQTSVLQLLLGHANIKTTQRYLHIRKKHLLEAWKRFHSGDQGHMN